MKAYAIAVLCVFLSVTAAPSARAAIPAKPDDVRKDRISDTEVLITWEDVSDDEDGFEILRRLITDTNADFELRGVVGAGSTSFIDEAPRSPVFIYRVRAFNQDGDSSLSNECYVNRNKPAVPLYFNVRLISLTVARVAWSDRSAGERGFDIQRAPLGKRFRSIVKVPPNTEVYDDYTLEPAHSYTYRVRALGRPSICWDNGSFTPERSLTTAGAVRILQVDLSGRGKGKVISIPEGISCGPKDDHCTAEFPLASDVTLYADPNDNSRFGGWLNILACEDTKGPCEFNMGKDRIIGARFRPID